MEQNALTSLLLPAALVLIMYGVGLDLRIADFARVVSQPRGIIAGTLAQMVLLPIIGVSLAFTFPLTPALAVGVVIVAACPGGAVSNLISYLAKADVALSVSLTAVSSVLTVLTIPFILNFAIRERLPELEVELPFIWTSLKLAGLTLLPVIGGMATRAARPEFAMRSEKVRRSSVIILLIVIVLAVGANAAELPRYLRVLLVPLLALNGAAIATGWVIGKLARLDDREVWTVMIETGIQNGALGITIPAVLIGVEEMAVPPAIYGIFMLISGALLAIASPTRRGDRRVK